MVTKPFAGDAMAQRMRGMDDMTYTFVTAPSVPGEIVSIEHFGASADYKVLFTKFGITAEAVTAAAERAVAG